MKKKLISTIISISVITGIFTPIPIHAEDSISPNIAMANAILYGNRAVYDVKPLISF